MEQSKRKESQEILCEVSSLKEAEPELAYNVLPKLEVAHVMKDEYYRIIIHGSIDAFILSDTSGAIWDVNEAWCQMYGYSHEEALSMFTYSLDCEYLISPHQFFLSVNNANKLGEVTKKAIKVKRKDGRIIDVLSSFQYIDIGPGLFFSFNTEITEQKRLNQQLKESEERYRALVELGGKVGEAVVMTQDTENINGLQIFISDKWTEMTGYSREELLKMSFFDIIHPISRETALKRYIQKKEGDVISELFELIIVRKDGTGFPVEVTSAYSIYDEKKVNVSYIRDITERKQLENDLKKYQEHLEILVNKRTQELGDQINQRISYTRALVHELKTPLSPLLASSDYLVSQIKEENLLPFAINVNRGAIHLSTRIDELLELAKMELGLNRIKCNSFNFQKLLTDIVEYSKPEASMNGQTLILDLPDYIPQIWADEGRIKQVIFNLLNNAFKYTNRGGTITIKAKEKNEGIAVEVTDTGRGIDKEKRKHLFTPIYKQKDDTKDNLSGLGIGLQLSKTFIDLHGGKIWVQSEKGKGSTIGFWLPYISKVK